MTGSRTTPTAHTIGSVVDCIDPKSTAIARASEAGLPQVSGNQGRWKTKDLLPVWMKVRIDCITERSVVHKLSSCTVNRCDLPCNATTLHEYKFYNDK